MYIYIYIYIYIYSLNNIIYNIYIDPLNYTENHDMMLALDVREYIIYENANLKKCMYVKY